ALRVQLDEQTMPAHFDVLQRCDGLERPEQRYLNLQAGQLPCADRREARIGAAGGDRAVEDDAFQRLIRFEMSDTSPQLAAIVDADECATAPGEALGGGQVEGGDAFHVRADRIPRHLQQPPSICFACHDVNRRARRARRALLALRAQCSLRSLSNVPKAAAKYPTTADVSPETSPESA